MKSQNLKYVKSKRPIAIGFIIAAIVSLVWIVVTLVYLPTTESESPLRLGFGNDLNEMGDYLAGAFAPVAFLWLILGYLQQGHELRNSIAEMQNSLEEQKEQTKLIKQSSDVSRRSLFLTAAQKMEEEMEVSIKEMVFEVYPATPANNKINKYIDGAKASIIEELIKDAWTINSDFLTRNASAASQAQLLQIGNNFKRLFERLYRLAVDADGINGELVAFYCEDSMYGLLYSAIVKHTGEAHIDMERSEQVAK